MKGAHTIMFSDFCLYSKPLTSISSYMQMVDFASGHGITKLEPINTMEFSNPDPAFVHRLKAYADEKGISFPCVSAGINLVGEDRVRVLEYAKKQIEAAAILGAPYFHHTIALEWRNPKIIQDNAELFYQRGIEAVRILYDYAKQFNIKTVYEDQGFLFNGCAGFRRFLQDVGREVGVVADFGNIHLVDESIEPFIREFADWIVHVHVKDYFITPRSLRPMNEKEHATLHGNYLQAALIGQGNVPIAEAFRCLKDIGYSGSISLESPPMGPDEEESFLQNVEAMERLLYSEA